MPLLVSVQNALQGFLVSEGRTWGVNQAAWVGAIVMLGTAYLASPLGQNGAISAAIGMILGNAIEIGCLFYNWRSVKY
jgi:progressive ankylosis protein